MNHTFTPEQACKIAHQWGIKQAEQLALSQDMSKPAWMREDHARKAAVCQQKADALRNLST